MFFWNKIFSLFKKKKIVKKVSPPKKERQSFMTTCPNCGKESYLERHNAYFICPYCQCKYIPTWREIGIDADELNPNSRIILENPNKIPKKDNYYELFPPLENGIILNDEIKKSDYKGGLSYNLNWIREEEKKLAEDFWCPAPRPFTNLAMLARKTKNYELEIAVCKRAQELIKIHDRMVMERGIPGEIKFSQTSISKVVERLPRAIYLLENSKEKTLSSIKKINSPKKNRALEKLCSEFSIHLEYINIDWCKEEKLYVINEVEKYKRPEDAILSFIKKDGWHGTAYELHPLELAMKAACFEYVEEKSKNLFMENFIARDFSTQIFLYKLDREIAIKIAKQKSVKEIINTCDFLLNYEENMRYYPFLKTEDINYLFSDWECGSFIN